MPIDVQWDDAQYARKNGNDRYEDMSLEDFWLRFEGKPGMGNQYRVRFLGMPVKFATHYNNKIDPITQEKKRIAFPDAEIVTKKKRNCTDGDVTLLGGKSEKCPWCKLGYQVTIRYMVNIAYYGKLDQDGDPTIMMAEVPASAWDDIRGWAIANKESCPEGPGTLTGKAPNFAITVKVKGKKTEYSVQTACDSTPLPDEIKRALKKFNPKAETMEEVTALHDLKRWCTPTYMSGQLQIEKFGKLIDQVPYSERQKRDDDAEETEEADESDEFGSTADADVSDTEADMADGEVNDVFGMSDEVAEGDATLSDNPLNTW